VYCPHNPKYGNYNKKIGWKGLVGRRRKEEEEIMMMCIRGYK
jgi:hypothetical protein